MKRRRLGAVLLVVLLGIGGVAACERVVDLTAPADAHLSDFDVAPTEDAHLDDAGGEGGLPDAGGGLPPDAAVVPDAL